MSSMLSVKHCQQEEEAGCLAACAQMVLTTIGISVTQRELNHLFGLQDAGSRYTHLGRLVRYGVQVEILPGDQKDLQLAVDQGTPPILFVLTGQLTSYWSANVRHAVVLIGYDDTNFYLNDPPFPDAPKQVPIDKLMLAWLEFDYLYALITR